MSNSEIIQGDCLVRPEVKERLFALRFQRRMTINDLPKIEKGNCRWCGKPTNTNKRTWCSNSCREEFLVRWSAQITRNRVFQRDKGICATCGIDTDYIKKFMVDLRRSHPDIYFEIKKDKTVWGMWLTHHFHYWEADHIVPVVEGGGCCGLENYQTLCLKCHKKDSAQIVRNLFAVKRVQAEKDKMGLFAGAEK